MERSALFGWFGSDVGGRDGDQSGLELLERVEGIFLDRSRVRHPDKALFKPIVATQREATAN